MFCAVNLVWCRCSRLRTVARVYLPPRSLRMPPVVSMTAASYLTGALVDVRGGAFVGKGATAHIVISGLGVTEG